MSNLNNDTYDTSKSPIGVTEDNLKKDNGRIRRTFTQRDMELQRQKTVKADTSNIDKIDRFPGQY